MVKIAERVSRAHYAIRDPEIAMKVSAMKKRGKKVLELNIGDPGANNGAYGFHMLSHMKQAIKDAVDDDGKYDGYEDGQGSSEVREAVAEDSRKQGIHDAKAENVIIGNGLSELIDYFLGIVVQRSINIVMPKPVYPLYSARVGWYGGEARYYSLNPHEGWKVDFEGLEGMLDEKTAAVVLINPGNPAGNVFERADLKRLLGLVRENSPEAVVVSDEIYRLLRSEGKHVPTASVAEDVPVITLDGISKGFFSPGWRMGHMLLSNFGDNTVLNSMLKICSLRLSANKAVQHAYAAGLRDFEKNKKEFVKFLGMIKERAAYATKRLNSINGITCPEVRGAFYAFPRIESKKWKNDRLFVLRLLEQEQVLVVPGSGFGMSPEDMHFRVVTLPDINTQKEAYDRVERFVNR